MPRTVRRSILVASQSRRGSAATSSSGSTCDADQTSRPTRTPVCSSKSRKPHGCSSDDDLAAEVDRRLVLAVPRVEVGPRVRALIPIQAFSCGV